MTDTAEYWNDVKRGGFRLTITHYEGFECGHYHKYESKKLTHVTCNACLLMISNDPDLSEKKQIEDQKSLIRIQNERRKKRGYKLKSTLKFGKYKGTGKTLQWVIDNDKSYFKWMQDKVLFHPEVDVFLIPETATI